MILLNFYCPLSPLQHWGVNPPSPRHPLHQGTWLFMRQARTQCQIRVWQQKQQGKPQTSSKTLRKDANTREVIKQLENQVMTLAKKMGIPTFSQSWTSWILAESRMGHPSQLYKQQLVVQGFSCIKLSPLQDR